VPSRPGQPTANADSKTAPTGAVKKSSLTAEQIERIRNGASVQAALRNKPAPVVPPPGAPTGNNANKNNASPPAPQPGAAPAGRNVGSDTEEDSDKKGAKGAGNPLNRDQRQKARADRARDRKTTVNSIQVGRDGHVEVIESQAGSRVKIRHKKEKKPITAPRKGKVPIDLPITVRKLSEAIGVKASTIITRFIKQGASLSSVTINSVLEQEFAEVLALEQNCELEIRKAADAEQDLIDEGKGADSPENLILRAPVVTIMGHVDHGKTSLLDKIRQQYGLSSDVVSTEAGGITQVIRAWRVEKDGRPVTFLDTPGHEAFTKMRARGAQVTDVAVIVVAATDGVMPQTEEAISHAKAANVAMVVAINKVDAASANDIAKTERQLYSLNVLPDNMGGDVPFLRTSARTGQGIDDLLETLALVAELRELKANPNRPAVGTCLEAHLKGDEGVQATLLVQAGTLRKGDIILCGATYGRVRAMYNDIGRSTPEAGPSVPVRVTGLDEVPNADDPFYVVKDIVTAREMAEKRKSKLAEAAMSTREPMKLENLGAIKIAELKVILKADFRGSIEAIRKELEKLTHDEVRVRVLHTGIGAVTASDVQLALTSPSDTIIVGFNAVPDDEALAMAEAQGVQIREYDIIYNLTNDIKEALQGKLKPREEVIHLGRAVVRDTFKISRVGTVAGCHVTTGTIERSSKVRIIRDGVVLYPPSERTVGLESLKRFKEDTKEVREGFECGIKVAGFDDIKVGDVIEAFRIDSVKRTL
jgi:translation initiation factor IF-2